MPNLSSLGNNTFMCIRCTFGTRIRRTFSEVMFHEINKCQSRKELQNCHSCEFRYDKGLRNCVIYGTSGAGIKKKVSSYLGANKDMCPCWKVRDNYA